MTTVHYKPFVQHLTEHLQNVVARYRSVGGGIEQVINTPSMEQETTVDVEVAFLTSIAHLPEAERNEHIQRREWYAAMAARQGIAEVEWHQQQFQQTGNLLLSAIVEKGH
jgi:hypothetical protein